MINNKFLLASFIICFFIKINKILKIIKILEIIKILNDFYNSVRSKELGSFVSLIFSFIFSYMFFSVIILENSS